MNKMRKKYFIIFLLLFLTGIIYADDYYWDLVDALSRDDFQKVETILKENINSMSNREKRLAMSSTITYSHGKNTINVLDLLKSYNILPIGFDLYTAIKRNQTNDVIQYLIQNGVMPNGEILLLAMEKKRFYLAKQFIEAGVDVNYRYSLSRKDADGMTPLLYAVKWNNFEMTKLLVEKGANINSMMVNGNTALTIAFINRNDEISNYLIEHGAKETINNVNQRSQNAGIASIMDNQSVNFKTGTYTFSKGNNSIKFVGNKNAGNAYYTNEKNKKGIIGAYSIDGNNLTIILDGRTFVYRIDSDEAFSGNGETWVRVGN